MGSLDVRVESRRRPIRVFTQTAEPVSTGLGRTAYGSTEFVFRLEPPLLQASGPRSRSAGYRALAES